MQGGSPSSTASQPPKADKTWWGRFRSFKHVRPALPQGLVPVWQITWVVYVSGRRYSICFQLDQEHRLARLLVNDFEIMRKSYNLVERVREHPFLRLFTSMAEPWSGLWYHAHLPPAPATRANSQLGRAFTDSGLCAASACIHVAGRIRPPSHIPSV